MLNEVCEGLIDFLTVFLGGNLVGNLLLPIAEVDGGKVFLRVSSSTKFMSYAALSKRQKKCCAALWLSKYCKSPRYLHEDVIALRTSAIAFNAFSRLFMSYLIVGNRR